MSSLRLSSADAWGLAHQFMRVFGRRPLQRVWLFRGDSGLVAVPFEAAVVVCSLGITPEADGRREDVEVRLATMPTSAVRVRTRGLSDAIRIHRLNELHLYGRLIRWFQLLRDADQVGSGESFFEKSVTALDVELGIAAWIDDVGPSVEVVSDELVQRERSSTLHAARSPAREE